MPRDNNQRFSPHYSLNSQDLYKRLASVRASGSAYAVMGCLLAYDFRSTGFAWPTQETIANWLGNGYSLRTIQTAIKFLEDNKFIKRIGSKKRQRYAVFVDKPSPKTSSQSSTKTSSCEEEKGKQKSKVYTPNPLGASKQTKNKNEKEQAPKPRRQPRKSPEERRAEKVARAKARADKQRLEETKRLYSNPIVLKQKLSAELDFIALGQTSTDLPKEFLGDLKEFVEEWFTEMHEVKRKFLRLASKDDLWRIYNQIEEISNIEDNL